MPERNHKRAYAFFAVVFLILLLAAFHVFLNVSRGQTNNLVLSWVREYDSGRTDSSIGDQGDIAVDQFGNAYLVGYSREPGQDGQPSQNDFRILKYDTNGMLRASTTFDLDGIDKVNELDLDEARGVAVTTDTSTVDLAWVATSTIAGGDRERLTDVAVDSNGNIYVTGYFEEGNSNDSTSSIYTAKYDSLGNKLWDAAYYPAASVIGSSIIEHRGNGIALDPTENFVYVAGTVRLTGTPSEQLIVLRYTTSNGDPVAGWPKTYDQADYFGDRGNDVAVDSNGDVYVAGGTGPSGDLNFLVVKFDTTLNSNPVWVNIYIPGGPAQDDEALGITIDRNDNIYATGYFGAGNDDKDFFTIKYDTSGNIQAGWPRPLNYQNDDDIAYDVAVDSAGDIYVTGVGTLKPPDKLGVFLTVKYAPDGTYLWGTPGLDCVNCYLVYDTGGSFEDVGNGIATDVLDNFYLVGYTSPDPTTPASSASAAQRVIKYNASGAELWQKTYEANFVDQGNGIAVGASGNIYTAGFYATPSLADEVMQLIAYAPKTSVYVVGVGTLRVDGFDNDQDHWTVVKFDADLKQVSTSTTNWPVRYDSGNNGFERAQGVTVDTSGNVYVTGIVDPTGVGNHEWHTRKYDSSGNEIFADAWPAILNSGDQDWGFGIAFNKSNGFIYVTGATKLPASSHFDFFTNKFDLQGNNQGGRLDNYYNLNDFAEDIAVDSQGNVIVTGISYSTSGLEVFRTIKYTADLAIVWDKVSNIGGVDRAGQAYGVTVDPYDDVFVSGYTFDQAFTSTTPAFLTIKYASSTGNVLWYKIFDSGRRDYASGIAANSLGEVYVGGESDAPQNMRVVKYGFSPLAGCDNFSIQWTNDPLQPDITLVRKVHVDELRAWINNRRQDIGLSPFSWTDPDIIANSTLVRDDHINDLRTAISGVHTTCGQTAPTWSETLTANVTNIRAIHVEEIRDKVETIVP